MLYQLSSRIKTQLANAQSYGEWCDIARSADKAAGMELWRNSNKTHLYDYAAIENRLIKLRHLRQDGDDHGLLFALNEGIHGNMGGMGNAELFKQTLFGTKQLIHDYIDEVSSALEHLAAVPNSNISLEEKLEFFQRASHCFGRSALMLSGSGSLFYFHLGVVKAFWEQGTLPSVITGASGGAIVGGIFASHTQAELEKIFDPDYLKIEIEQKVGLHPFGAFLTKSHVSPQAITSFLQRIIPDLTFQEATQRSGIHLNVSVAPVESLQSSRLLNDIASPNVMLREALLASSAFPGFFPPVTLAARDQSGQRKSYLLGRKWMDGSVSDDLPIKRVMRLYGVNHTIVSQTNPVALPFIRDQPSAGVIGTLKQTCKNTAKEWALAAAKILSHQTKFNKRLNHLVRLSSSVLAQTYTGDINILPPRRLHNPLELLSQRGTEEIQQLILHGERAAWPKLETVRLQTKISRTLDTLITNLESEILHNAQTQKVRARKNTA